MAPPQEKGEPKKKKNDPGPAKNGHSESRSCLKRHVQHADKLRKLWYVCILFYVCCCLDAKKCPNSKNATEEDSREEREEESLGRAGQGSSEEKEN